MYGNSLHPEAQSASGLRAGGTLRKHLCVLLVLAFSLFFAPKANARNIIHVVRSGQNLGMIAKRYHTSVRAIERHNGLKPGQHLRRGQRLKIYEVAEHRRWRRFVEEKLKPKKKPAAKATNQKGSARSDRKTDKKRGKKSRRKKAGAKKSRSKKSSNRKTTSKRTSSKKRNHNKDAARKTASKKATAKKAAAKKASVKKGVAKKARSKKAGGGSKHRKSDKNAKRRANDALKRTREPRLYEKYRRKPRRKGYVTMVRHSERFRGQLMNSRGRLVPRGTRRVDRLLRSLRTGKKTKINRRLVRLLAQTSDHFGGRAIILVSGYRPFSKKQYTRNSRHNHGRAVDFRIVGVPNRALYEYCRTLSKVGCGYYPNSVFVHMDVREHKTQWTDYSRPGQKPIYAHRLKKRKAAAAARKRRKSRRTKKPRKAAPRRKSRTGKASKSSKKSARKSRRSAS